MIRIKNIQKQRKILKILNKKLSAKIIERKQTELELIHARDKAEKADKLKSEFLAQISHEIRSPVNIISNYVSLMKEELSDKVSDIVNISFDAIDKANNRITRSIELVLNMSELQLGTYNPEMDKLNLKNDILSDLIVQYSHSAKQKNIEISFESNLDNPIILGDRYSVTQIFANLTDNAIKYSNTGKISILLKNGIDNKIRVIVKDTGLGISEEYLPNIFEAFSQEEGGYTRKYDGNGLGLALVKKYCDLNNASIFVKSTKGLGTTFTVEFDKYNHTQN
jgi:signal transduction histidine kinase